MQIFIKKMILLLNINFFCAYYNSLNLLFFSHFLENKIQIEIRYSETDQMSFVYHGNYVKFFEMGRIAWLKNRVSYRKMEENGIINLLLT